MNLYILLIIIIIFLGLRYVNDYNLIYKNQSANLPFQNQKGVNSDSLMVLKVYDLLWLIYLHNYFVHFLYQVILMFNQSDISSKCSMD